MTAEHDANRARRYLLGLLPDEEHTRLEEQYLGDQAAVDRVAAAEDELIEDYLSDRLTGIERERFEQGYMAAPRHRIRVETVRRLQARARSEAPEASSTGATVVDFSRKSRSPSWLVTTSPKLALAASLILVAATAWLLVPTRQTFDDGARATSTSPQSPGSVSAPAPSLVALVLSPVAVRSATDGASVTIPAGTDQLLLRLESEGGGRPLTPTRATVRTVSGTDVWEGPAPPASGAASGVVAEIGVPARALATDDYLVTLYGRNGPRTEEEWMQYFLRVRRP